MSPSSSHDWHQSANKFQIHSPWHGAVGAWNGIPANSNWDWHRRSGCRVGVVVFFLHILPLLFPSCFTALVSPRRETPGPAFGVKKTNILRCIRISFNRFSAQFRIFALRSGSQLKQDVQPKLSRCVPATLLKVNGVNWEVVSVPH